VLAALTLLVWSRQAVQNRHLIVRHTQDVCDQAARRVQLLVDSRLDVVTVFAKRWVTHGGRDYSRRRFEEFSTVVIRELPGYHAMRLITDRRDPGWVVPRDVASDWMLLGAGRDALLGEALKGDRVVLSAPFRQAQGHVSLFGALALRRAEEFLGYLVVEFRVDRLVSGGFGARIRSEFRFAVQDGSETLFVSPGDLRPGDLVASAIHARQPFDVRNRRWELALAPMEAHGTDQAWWQSVAVPALGLPLSLGLSYVVALALGRMMLYRAARDHALLEIAEREKAEVAMRASEARYRSVFESTTDGLLVLDPEDRIIEANLAACSMQGLERERLRGMDVRELIAPDHRGDYEAFKRQLEDAGAVRQDSIAVRADGSTMDVELRGADFQYGGQPGVLVIVTDVSARKRAMEQHALLSRKVLMAQEEERARLSRELHDELGQVLTAVHLELGWLQKHVCVPAEGTEKEKGASPFRTCSELVEKAAGELRRICRGLRPPLLDDLGLEPAAHLLIEEFEERTSMVIDSDIQLEDGAGRVRSEVALCVYRVLQEALNNASRHSSAHRVSVSLKRGAGSLLLSVSDDGHGFAMSDLTFSQGCGLAGMRERSILVSGALDVHSSPSQGTQVTLRVPLEPEQKTEDGT
jgi:PAS domain S-box-containing protein